MRDGGRRVYQQVTLSEDEQARLRARAEELAVSVPRLLATVANNVNQLARQANTSGELPAAARLEGMRAEVLDLVRELREVTGARA